MPRFTATPLQEDHIAAAYPLIRAVAPVALERWEAFARRRIGDGNILGLFAGDATLLGLAIWRSEDCLRRGPTLRAEALVTFELDRLAPARRALCGELERLAVALGLDALVLEMPVRGRAGSGPTGAEAWQALGFTAESLTYVKQLGDPRAVGLAAALS